MKKAFLTLAGIALFAMVFTSCKSHERCAAYSKAEKMELSKPAVKAVKNS